MSREYSSDRDYRSNARPRQDGEYRRPASRYGDVSENPRSSSYTARSNGQRPGAPRPNGQRPSGQRPNGQRSANSRPNAPRPNGQRPNRRPPQKKKPIVPIIIAAVILLIIVGVVLFFVLRPSNDPVEVINPQSTAAPIEARTSDDVLQPEATEEVSHSESLAAMLGDESSSITGLSADQMAHVDDLAITPDLPDDWLNILLLGSDERSMNDSSRTDSMIICSINLKTGSVKLSSIMRDLAVDFDEIGEYNGTYRINAANYFGGEELAMRVVNESFGLNIQNYVHVNFFGFQEIAHLLGGIDVDITEAEMEEINYRIVEQHLFAKKAGVDDSALPKNLLESYGENTHLDGRQTLAYARIRKLDGGDYARAERQRTVLVKLLEKVKQMDTTTLLSLINTGASYIRTNMSLDTILSVAITVVQNGIDDVPSFRLPVNDSYVQETRNNQSMLYDCDWSKNASELKYFIYE